MRSVFGKSRSKDRRFQQRIAPRALRFSGEIPADDPEKWFWVLCPQRDDERDGIRFRTLLIRISYGDDALPGSRRRVLQPFLSFSKPRCFLARAIEGHFPGNLRCVFVAIIVRADASRDYGNNQQNQEAIQRCAHEFARQYIHLRLRSVSLNDSFPLVK